MMQLSRPYAILDESRSFVKKGDLVQLVVGADEED
jgi:hypothetical protein